MSTTRRNSSVPSGWRMARFAEFLQRVDRRFELDDATSYRCVGVRWYGLGAFVREELLGMNIQRKQQWIINAGDIVYNKLFAWKGSFAIADNEVDGCIVSDKFPTYKADPSQIDLAFLRYYFKTARLAQQAQDLSKGAAAISKLTLNPPQFWDLTIPLPPLAEQRRIVRRIEALAGRIEEARGLRREAAGEVEALLRSHLARVFNDVEPTGLLGDVLSEKPRNGWSATPDNHPSGTPVLTLSAITGFTYRSSAFKRTSQPTNPEAYYWLKPGDLLITRSNTPDLVGHAAIYDGSPYPCVYPDLAMRLSVDEDRADKLFVHRWLQAPLVRDYIRGIAKGTSPSMKKINQDGVMGIPFPTRLSLAEQRRIVAYLDELQARVDGVRRLQAETQAELEAMLPAVLDRAFKGGL